jgi:hypothetical protein
MSALKRDPSGRRLQVSEQDEKNVERENIWTEDPDVEAHKKKVAEEPEEDDADFEAHKKK